MIVLSPLSKTANAATIPSVKNRNVGGHRRALLLLLAVFMGFFGLIGSRLFYLQLIEGDRYRQLATDNRIRLISREPTRGRILDRNGQELAGSRLSYAVYVWMIATREESWTKTRKQLAQLLGISDTEIQKRLEQSDQESPFLLRIAQGLSPVQVIAIKELAAELPGVVIDTETVRYYPNGDLAAHVLGYIGEISEDELGNRADRGYRPGDVVGVWRRSWKNVTIST
ncbi:MAG TPA: hypothetical protein IGS53_28845 [Leptolyngbyaceae cyanobacterium M33_DOE_097]|uniref:Penicillin-binding protein dimerisation domain-containing protein n=1 Tax=Oscillatoriales cyanobacterium SpSt-418 TaxID=2282169 RepID=A0A7C3PGL2_9CYAN|nr:hypothetical protein [Leptolyngbyaceae cyanobacterium M33_DOE_097]